MPTFEKTIFTNLGISFINDLNSAHSRLVSAKTVYSSSDLSGMSDDDIKNMTDIANKELTANCDILKLDGHQTKIRSTANNEQLKQGIYIRSYATYVVDQDGNQTLFAIKVNTKPQYLAAYDGVNTNAQSYGFNVGISQTDSINFTKLSNLAATMQDLDIIEDNVNKTFQYRGQYSGNLLNVVELADGYYLINGNSTNGPEGWDGYGQYGIKHVGSDLFIELYDNYNHHWTNHYGNGNWDHWRQVPDTDELNNIYQFRGQYDGNLLNIVELKDGYYLLNGNNTNVPINFSGFGQFNVRHIGSDLYVEVYDSFNNQWTNNYSNSNWKGWKQVASIADVNNVFQYRGQYDGNLLNVASLLDGYYQINNNTNNGPEGFDGYGYFQKKVVGADFYIEIYDNFNHHWTNHHGNGNWDGWKQVPDTEEVNNTISYLQNNINSKVNINDAFVNRGQYEGNLLDVVSLKDGYYLINGKYSNGPDGFSGFGQFDVRHVGSDLYIELSDNFNRHWNNHYGNGNWDGWAKTSDEDEVSSIYQRRGQYDGNVLNVVSLKDGYYLLNGNNTNTPNGFSGFGQFSIKHVGSDLFIELYDNYNHHWTNHYGNGDWDHWRQVPDTDKVNDLQTQLNAVNKVNSVLINGYLRNWELKNRYLTNHYPNSIPDFWFNTNDNTFRLSGKISVNSGDIIVFENKTIKNYMDAKGYSSISISGSWLNFQNITNINAFVRNESSSGVIQLQSGFTGDMTLDGIIVSIQFN